MRLRPAHLPNAISILRILLVLPIVLALLAGDYLLALLLICFAGASDGLDGLLARRFDWRSRLGGILDPLADKLMVTALFLTLAWLGLSPVWLTAVVILRDAVIVAGALAYNSLVGEVQPEPTGLSKANTILQLIYVLGVVSRQALGWPAAAWLLPLGAAVFFACVVSGLDYVLTWGARARAAQRR